ncbi:MAG TPA: histidine kinase N-terminal domain-containing protein [Anaerolineae bacterium]|nr:histidine kinase N-terminal domain-containing protein [Anaerolineae bacterium]
MDGTIQDGTLPEADVRLLDSIRKALPILSDISRSDLLLYLPTGSHEAVISDQARPHSIFRVYEEDLVGKRVDEHEAPWVFRALSSNRLRRGVLVGTVRDAQIVREVVPAFGSSGRAVAALSIETNLLAHERHRRRMQPFRSALSQLQEMVLRGELVGAEALSPFGEHDGILIVDVQSRILYTSGIATNLFRRIGYMGSLVGRSVYGLETADAELIDEALNLGRCIERETNEHGRIWIRKAIPLYVRRSWKPVLRRVRELASPKGSVPQGVVLSVHDATEARDKERELKAKLAMIQEIHHRVKNNLQSIVSLLRLQARRTGSTEVIQALGDTVNRILSIAVVHEFLSHDSGSVINLRDIAQRIAKQISESIVDPDKNIRITVTGPSIYLTSQQATSSALVINELLQNAVDHGYRDRGEGLIAIHLVDGGEWVSIEVADDGMTLAEGFDLDENSGLGLRIVRALAQSDLKGSFELSADGGVRAIVTFPKTSLGGSENWSAREY